ncbi:mannose-1-phosphate guanylyltransferase [Heterostelium album PN500]|uniref:Mannose-1-phosphate guanylyltransferase n=1 Tax=Heterostelium pallidum (strain ATCC 26659 / Pp 5 / PN500) TaxID=670386 RepID=D3AZL0_HETP5|nr:mannose-1-phosphate guanylyltransferase [Heterostelium album PN500]EFA85389.1 mannose-1-phosphate guanylyltransferase [Heterostelium album PN500]|eukprot:XP_020437498.1 mannose-1-phosphate guanylyltransferase [Heterostelium album PN500]
MGGVKAVILVGGPSKGTRFRPLSLDDVPKLLFPIAGKPMIYHHIEACSRVKGITEIILLGFFPENQLSAFIEQSQKELNVPIRYINEVKVLGTAGGLSRYREQILQGNPDYLFVLHSDICCAFPLEDLLNFHIKHKRICTIMGTRIQKEYANQYGCLIRDENTAELIHYAEKPETFVSDMINCGVYCISPSFFDIMAKTTKDLQESLQNVTLDSYPEITKKGFEQGRLRLEQDIFVPLAGTNSIVVYPYVGFWRQIKNAGSPVYCQELYLSHYAKTKPELLAKGDNIIGNVVIHPTATVDPTAKIGPDVYIGPNVKVGKGVRIFHSIILDETEIKGHACILYSIIGWRSEIGFWARIEGVPNYTPFLYSQDKRKGITIIGAGAQANGEIIVSNCIVMPHKQLDRNYCNEIIL